LQKIEIKVSFEISSFSQFFLKNLIWFMIKFWRIIGLLISVLSLRNTDKL
jgi:hypothetical protein